MDLGPNLIDLASACNKFRRTLDTYRDNPNRYVIPLPEGPLQQIFHRLRVGELTVLGGLPGHGKSALAEQLGFFIAKEFAQLNSEILDSVSDEDELVNDKEFVNSCAMYFTLEMNWEQLISRALTQLTHVPSLNIQEPEKITRLDWAGLEPFLEKIATWPMIIYDSSVLKSSAVEQYVSRLESSGFKPKLIIIDYLQLLADELPYGGNDVTKLDNITRTLKEIARKHECHIIALSSLNRGETDDFGIPTMNNIRGSGGIQYGADNILILHQPHKTNASLDDSWRNITVLKVEKQRAGKADVMYYMRFDEQKLRFENLSGAEQAVLPPLKARYRSR